MDETYVMPPLLVKALLLGVMPEEACFDNGYALPWSYSILGLMAIRPLIGFRRNAKPCWRGKPKTLRLRFRKMVNRGLLEPDRLQALDLDPDPDRNSLEKILSGLMIAGQQEYVGAYYRDTSLNEFCHRSIVAKTQPHEIVKMTHDTKLQILTEPVAEAKGVLRTTYEDLGGLAWLQMPLL